MVNEILEKIENDPIKREAITLRSVFGKQQGHLRHSPARDESTGRLLGVDLLSDEESRKAKKVINEDTTRLISDGSVFNLKNEIDALDWKWIRETKEVAPDFDSAQSSPAALFYIEDLDGDTERKIEGRTKKFEAMRLVMESSEDKKSKICRLLGNDPKYFSPLDITNYLSELAENDPGKVINAYTDKDTNGKLFLYELLDKRVVVKNYDGIYKYGNITLGISEDTTLYYLKDPANADILKQMYSVARPEFVLPTNDHKDLDDSFSETEVKNEKPSEPEKTPEKKVEAKAETTKKGGKKGSKVETVLDTTAESDEETF